MHSRSVRTGGALGHLLFVVVLALGVFVMHTMGHPDQSSGHDMKSAAHASTALTPAAAYDPMGAPPSLAQSHVTHPTQASSKDKPTLAMNMLSLCMAVMFGAWALATLLRMALARHPDWLAKFLAEAPVMLRPNPPPRGPDLTQLSVLRL
ncbi:hypothetical protein ACFV8Z_17055 [Streptomyces sp. NPDC059837]|uniref:hypothetical protein n=1 Tax=unclassified Streptomyces TaxID=2593676 RepID=UPI00225BC947|nr:MULTISPECIES: hypothetical protein [unclassified Streptomyces]MCX5190869.1 hypothetical protein [Streptomyces sp. NBC_00268]